MYNLQSIRHDDDERRRRQTHGGDTCRGPITGTTRGRGKRGATSTTMRKVGGDETMGKDGDTMHAVVEYYADWGR